jgi:hypothetical protein
LAQDDSAASGLGKVAVKQVVSSLEELKTELEV